MTSGYESTGGGLQKTIRTLATQASSNDSWREYKPQTVALERTDTLQEGPDVSLTVSFEARRVSLESFGERALRTFYIVRAIEAHEQLVLDELPAFARANMPRVRAEKGDGTDGIIISTGQSEEEIERLLEEDAEEDTDIRFRHEKVLQYRLDGNTSLMSIERRNRYVMLEEGDEEEVFDEYTFESLDPELEESNVLDLSSWMDKQTRLADVSEVNAEVAKEENLSTKQLHDDVQFLEIVQTYVETKTLHEVSRKEHTQTILALLAFVKLQGNAEEIRKLI